MIALMFRIPTTMFIGANQFDAGFARSQSSIVLNWFEDLKERLPVP